MVGSAEETRRLLLCEATAVVMRKCFHLLGITPVYKIWNVKKILYSSFFFSCSHEFANPAKCVHEFVQFNSLLRSKISWLCFLRGSSCVYFLIQFFGGCILLLQYFGRFGTLLNIGSKNPAYPFLLVCIRGKELLHH